MSLNLDKSTWKRVAFGDVIENVTDRVDDPSKAGVDRYVGLEHLDPGVMSVERWGTPDEVEAQKLRFQPGDVIFGRRRAYQKKVALADFEGICSAHALVLRGHPDCLDPDFLPVFLSSGYFLDRAISISVGSLSPTVNWRDLKVQEFDLPPREEQKRIAGLLWAVERYRGNLIDLARTLEAVDETWTRGALAQLDWSVSLSEVINPSRPLCYGVVQPGVDAEDGIPLIRVMDLEGGSPRIECLKRISPEIDAQYKRSSVVTGDVLLSIVGTIGRSWVVTDEFAGSNIARALARISPEPSLIRTEFLKWVLSSTDVQEALLSAAFESARKTLNLSVLSTTMLPQASLEMQDLLLEQRGELFQAGARIDAELICIENLHAAVLTEIFRGNG